MTRQGSKRFSAVLSECRGGLVDIDLSRQLSEAMERVRETGKKASITVTMTFDPHGTENTEIYVNVKSAMKIPAKPDMDERSIFFLTNNNELVRGNAQQTGMDFAKTGREAAEE